MAIPALIDAALQAHVPEPHPELQAIWEADGWAREFVRERVGRL
jgi:hypothetical protein